MDVRIATRFWSMRNIASALGIAFVAMSTGAWSGVAQAAEKVIFAWVPAIDALPWMVALE